MFYNFSRGTRIPINKNGEINTDVFAILNAKIPVVVVKHDAGKYWRNKKIC